MSRPKAWKCDHGANSSTPSGRRELGVIVHTDARGFVGIGGEGLISRQVPGGVTSLHVVYLLSILFLCAFEPAHLRAQDPQSGSPIGMTLEDLMKIDVDSVYGAAGYKQKLTETPASVTIITSDQIRKYGYRTLADILSNVPGFYVSYDRNYTYLGVRGFSPPGDYNSRILLLVDGHRLNDDVYGSALIGTEFPIDVDRIDRVEIIRGPNTSLYVASAFLGVINVITKRGQGSSDLTASAELASYGTLKGQLTYSRRLKNDLQFLLSGSFYDSRGQERLYFPEYDSPATNYGIAQDCDGDEYGHLLASLSYHQLVLHAAYGWREKTIPTGSFGTVFDDAGTRTIDAPGYLDLAYDHKFGEDWGYKAQLYYDHYTYNGTYIFDESASGGPERVANKDLGWNQRWGAEFDVSKKLAGNQTFVAGSEFRDDFKENQENYNAQPFTMYLNDHRSSTVWAAFAQDAISLHRNLVLDLGIRHDQYSNFGGISNPRADLIYSPFEKTTIKLLYGQAFRAPTAYEMFYSAFPNEANPHLKPETTKTTEAVLEQDLEHSLRLTVSGYFYPVRGQIMEGDGTAPGLIMYHNSGNVNLQGLELTLNKKLPSGLEAGGSFSYQDAKDAHTGSLLTNSPRQLAQAHLSVPVFRRQVYASLNAQYLSNRETLAGKFAGGYLLPNFTLFSREGRKGWEFSASLYNVFAKRYGDPGAEEHLEDIIYQDGRTFRIKLHYRF